KSPFGLSTSTECMLLWFSKRQTQGLTGLTRLLFSIIFPWLLAYLVALGVMKTLGYK
ncbi:hypothetical protein Bpfe_009537, partial [Biomphalaria pfeifferi]